MQYYTAPSGARVHMNADEDAGKKALARGGPKAREQLLWSILATELSYDAVFDLGANYGQVTLGASYPHDAEITLVEPNPDLIPYLERTIASHPNADQVRLHNVALGKERGSATLYVRHDAVGKSSMIRERGEATEVPLAPLDELAPPTPSVRNAILKVDVEGAELALLEGATAKLDSLDNYAIMIELHPGFMRRTGGSVGAYLESLCAYGYLWEQARNGRLKAFDFARFVRRNKLHDILIVSGEGYDRTIRAYNDQVRADAKHRELPTSTDTAAERRSLRGWLAGHLAARRSG